MKQIVGCCSQLLSLLPLTVVSAAGLFVVSSPVHAVDSIVVGSVRVQCLSKSLVRLEVQGPTGFEDRETFHVVDRNWAGVSSSTNVALGEVRISTPNYLVRVPAGVTSLS